MLSYFSNISIKQDNKYDAPVFVWIVISKAELTWMEMAAKAVFTYDLFKK
jgi:hypothetical protein